MSNPPQHDELHPRLPLPVMNHLVKQSILDSVGNSNDQSEHEESPLPMQVLYGGRYQLLQVVFSKIECDNEQRYTYDKCWYMEGRIVSDIPNTLSLYDYRNFILVSTLPHPLDFDADVTSCIFGYIVPRV